MKRNLLIVLLGLAFLLIFPGLSVAQFGSISGRVTDEGTGLPIVTAEVTVSGVYAIWYTDTSGYYLCDSLPPGLYLVNAQKGGYVPETYPDSVMVMAGENTPGIDFALTPGGEHGSISGQVTDEETGLPIIMAHVLAIGLDNWCYGEAWSDTGGYYAIQNMCSGLYQVSANKAGYAPETYPDSVMVTAGEDTPNIDFALTPAGAMGSISGEVTDEETGLPLPMAHVWAHDSIGQAWGDAWSDTAGLYLMQDLVAGQYVVGVHKDGYEDEVYPELVTVEEDQNTPDIDFALTPLGGPEFGSISGVVTDEGTGLPIVMAEITITGMYCIWYTDTSGYYLCDSLPPGLYLVNAQKEGYVPETYPDSVMVMAGENTPGIDFALTPGGEHGSISGQVTDEETGLPIIMAHVLAIGLDNWCYGEAWSDTGGYYAIQNMCPGLYQVSANKTGYIPETYPDSVIVTSGEDTPNIDFALTPAGAMGSISGEVTDEETGLPLPMAHVLAYDSTFCAGDAWTDTGGYYLIQNLSASQYIVGVHKAGYEDEVYPESVTVEQGQNTPDIDFALTPLGGPEFGSISGIVTDEGTGLPIAMAEITITGMYCVWYTDTSGYYLCDNLPPDCYQINARKIGYNPETYPDSVIVVAGGNSPDIDFALTPMGQPGSISGAITDAEIEGPILGAHVWACGEFGHGQAVTDSLGEYTIFGLYPGSYFVTAWAWGYWPQDYPDTVSVIEGQDTPGIDFALVPHGGPGEGVIAGQILQDSTFLPMPFAVVFGVSLQGNWGFDFTDSVGTYVIQGLQTDHYYVYAFAPGYIGEFYDGVYTWEEATSVTPDAYDIDFYLAPCGSGGGSISGTINSDGSPVEDAFVYAEASGEAKGFARSSTEGGYIISGLAAGTYTVSASKVPYHDGSYPDPVEIGSGKVSGIDIELPPIQVGDVSGDGLVDIGDVIYLINYLFIEGPAPDPMMTGDVNRDGVVNTGDVIYVINYLYLEGPAPCNP